ncbi:hypothetical protein AMJ40_04980 [candidate division TA06 bacterium DG_26]|uniref:FlgD Ig-like domain-containing protein n=1 Tax=candidate division TA06 bacterium DG_26 TaxID=1703771 RepID=A0A0S7WHS6_UNCT6|nr:MAG: hypothetical protein AMJ40_04980 [candidate division TA06 bacterium DG_26]
MSRVPFNTWRAVFTGLFIIPFVCTIHAQQYSTVDTIRVVDMLASPGSTVAIPIHLTNTFPVSGISLRIEYDPSVLSLVRVDTAGTRVVGVYDTFIEQGDPAEGWIFWVATNWNPQATGHLAVGSGLIAHVICMVDGDAEPGSHSSIEFVDDSLSGYYTALSDTVYPGTQMVIPVKDDGVLTIALTQVEEEINHGIPAVFLLNECIPNPILDEATITYGCPDNSGSNHMTIRIYDTAGRMVKTLFSGSVQPGYHSLTWDGTNDMGPEVASGVYFCKMDVDDGPLGLSRKLVVLK